VQHGVHHAGRVPPWLPMTPIVGRDPSGGCPRGTGRVGASARVGRVESARLLAWGVLGRKWAKGPREYESQEPFGDRSGDAPGRQLSTPAPAAASPGCCGGLPRRKDPRLRAVPLSPRGVRRRSSTPGRRGGTRGGRHIPAVPHAGRVSSTDSPGFVHSIGGSSTGSPTGGPDQCALRIRWPQPVTSPPLGGHSLHLWGVPGPHKCRDPRSAGDSSLGRRPGLRPPRGRRRAAG
jgi:hypothetical protein